MTGPIAPWQVWWADLDPQVRREQAGLRPAIVVGTALACELPNQLKSISRQRLRRRRPTRLKGEEIETIKFALRQMIDTR